MSPSTLPLAVLITTLGTTPLVAQDWPQWLGTGRNAKADGFQAPQTWPKSLTPKWKVPVGEGVATPALVGNRLYVFSRQDGTEVLRCLNTDDGKEIWQDRYDALGATGGAQSFSGPRSSPAVAQGKVVTLGIRGMLSCVDATTGKPLWRKDEFQAYPTFFHSSSPLIVGNLAIAQLGGPNNGAVAAYDLTSGVPQWKWTGASPAYASPVLMSVGGASYVIALTDTQYVALDAATGKLAWESEPSPNAPNPAPGQRPGGPGGGRGGIRDRKASTPIVDGSTLILSGLNIQALQLQKSGDQLTAKPLWKVDDKTLAFNTPILKDKLLFGLAGNNELFCIRTQDGTVAWSAPFPSSAPADAPQPQRPTAQTEQPQRYLAGQVLAQADPGRPRGPGGPGGPGGRRGPMGGGAGYGSIVDAGPALVAITPAGELIVFEPSDAGLKVLASYKVAPGQTYAYPVLSKNRIFIKDQQDLTLWTID